VSNFEVAPRILENCEPVGTIVDVKRIMLYKGGMFMELFFRACIIIVPRVPLITWVLSAALDLTASFP
jgi:hypothetical protein